MLSALFAIALTLAPAQDTSAAVFVAEVPQAVAADPGKSALTAATVQDSGVASAVQPIGPRVSRVAFAAPLPAPADSGPRPRAIEYSDAYYKRLTIHRVASYAELPLFATEYVLGERLLRDERTGYPPSSLKAGHAVVAGGLGILFAVNTVTGAWNLWDSRKDPAGRTLRIIHSAAMLGADAGFAWAGAIGGNARNSAQAANRHRSVSVGSMALATAGTAIMWFFNK